MGLFTSWSAVLVGMFSAAVLAGVFSAAVLALLCLVLVALYYEEMGESEE